MEALKEKGTYDSKLDQNTGEDSPKLPYETMCGEALYLGANRIRKHAHEQTQQTVVSDSMDMQKEKHGECRSKTNWKKRWIFQMYGQEYP